MNLLVHRPPAVFAVACSLAAALAVPSSRAAGEFVVVALPDTQNYSSSYPAVYASQTQWIANQAGALGIGFVTHLGDFVNNHDRDFQWTNAEAAMDLLDAAGIPWGGIPGNHDFLYGDGADDFTGSRYLARFGPQRFVGKPWYRGASPSQLSNYQVIDFGGTTILFLHLNLETPAAELAWAQGVLNQHRDKPVFVSTHRYLQDAENYTSGVPLVPSGRFPEIWYAFEPLYRPDGIKSEVFFNSFVKGNKNIFLVHCGHFHAEYRQASTNNWGLTVHELLADYQDDPNGGDGWLRLLTFRPEQNQLYVQTFSPSRNGGNGEFRTGSESQFTLSVDLEQYIAPPGSNLVRFQQGVGGYTGTRDTYVNSDTGGFFESDGPFTNTSFGNSSRIVVDNDWDNSPFGDEPTHGLLRFEDLFQAPVMEGDPLPTRIPGDATITQAVLSFNIIDDIDLFDEDLRLYRCQREWSESSTWNSLGSGVSGGELSAQLALIDGDNDPSGQTIRNVDVTSSVDLWRAGTPNRGFALKPENTASVDDGMEIASSEFSQVSLRPALDVEFDYVVLNRPPVVTPLAVSRPTVDEGESVVLTMSASDANPQDPLVFRINGAELLFGIGSASLSEVVVLEQDGSYHFAGEVSDDEATVSGGAVEVVVQNVPPTITGLTADLEVLAGASFQFEATATDPGVFDVLSCHWDLDGDGQFDDASGSSGTHGFGTPGNYTVTLRVSDDGGGEVFGSFEVTVLDPYLVWAAQNGVTGGPDDDDDGDGMSNEAERLLDYDPRDPTDFLDLAVALIDVAAGEVTLRYSEVKPLGTYRLYWTSDPNSPAENWTPVHAVTPGTFASDYLVVDRRDLAAESRGFYQVRFEPSS